MVPILDNMSVVTGDIEGQRQTSQKGVDGTAGGPFGDILHAQGGPRGPESEVESGHEPGSRGGNVVQSGGKDLPDRSQPEPAALALTSPVPVAPAALLSPEGLASVGNLPTGNIGPSLESLPIDKIGPSLESLPIDNTGPSLESLPVDNTGRAALAAGQIEKTANHSSTPAAAGEPEILPVGQIARAPSVDKPAPVPASETAITGVAPGHSDALSKLKVTVEGPQAIARDNDLSQGNLPQSGGQDTARLTRAVEPATQAGLATLEGAPMGVREGALSEASDLLKGLEPNQVKQAVTVQAQPVAGSIQMPAAEADLSQGLKVGASSTITTPVGDPGWNGELAGRVSLMVKNGMPEANLQLSPPELGRLDIRITTEGDQARIQFAVQSGDAREAIEQAMPRLREMLEQSGLQLARSEVADYSQSRQGEGHVFGTPSDPASADQEENPDESIGEFAVSAPNSTVDYYV